ncbi:sulfate ABC transporter substrate-binding protein [Chitinasiproducens palmae]|uniref:Sulfate transport system substrate-binding protein n=1 Tax=Chitinasiproducens palmae TaxID=1770053 RepID=A0A1H2PKY1_9BURK|nr:sulfate ABC transporter substrate-binding protein [Chitinasiproducens palmae]SDV47091.1 sulfate transport system substrate-binding protein [Chitinasiproducens palmae]
MDFGKRAFLQRTAVSAAALAALGLAPRGALAQDKTINLLNVSYDPTRELYEQYNKLFAAYWKAKTGQTVAVRNSHGGSGKQARSVIDGVDADVVTLGLAPDVDALVTHGGLIKPDWQKRLPHNSAPYTSTIIFLVKKGNPKGIKDWDDLAKPGVSVITPNPKTSAGARWNYLAAWEYGRRKYGGDAGAKDFVGKIYRNVPVLDSGARGSTITFAQRGVGDVLVSWENDAFLALHEFGDGKFELITPSVSILTEPTVAVVDKNVDRKGTRTVAEAYLQYLYSDEAQDLIGRNYYRPTGEKAKAKYASQFPKLDLVTIDGAFGGWPKADKAHFADGGTFDQIYLKK